jgi:hypothetical protein
MPLWDKLKNELDRAGRVAQGALDEGKLRLEVFRVRQLADKAAQTLGYAVYRSRSDGRELDAESYGRLAAALKAHEDEATRLERQLEDVTGRKGGGGASPDGTTAPPGGQAGNDMPPVNPS